LKGQCAHRPEFRMVLHIMNICVDLGGVGDVLMEVDPGDVDIVASDLQHGWNDEVRGSFSGVERRIEGADKNLEIP